MNTAIPSSIMEPLTTEQRVKLDLLQCAMTTVALPVGPMHAWWDPILDIRECLAERRTLLTMTPEERIADAESTLTRWGYKLPY